MPTPAPDPRAQVVLQQLEHLPTLPSVAVRVLEITGQERAAARELAEVIESDPSLSARLLRIVHRADGGLRSDITSVQRAVVHLGFEAVRNAVLAVGVFDTFGGASRGPTKFDRADFWTHCLAVACMSELIAETIASDAVSPSDAFVGGLLHDLGKIALDAALPKSFARVIEASQLVPGDIADLERTIIGLDHLVVGKRLAERWMLPAMFREVMWLHGQSPEALPASCKHAKLVTVVTLADAVARRQHLGFSGNHAFGVPTGVLLAALGMSDEELATATDKLVSRLEPRVHALGLGESTGDDLYRHAITQANRELGRLADQLAAKNRKLATRAKFFETLTAFHADLKPDMPAASVLFAIAQAAARALDANAACAFGYQPSAAEYMVVGENAVIDRGVVEHVADPIASPGVRRAGDDSEWVTAVVGPKLGGSAAFQIDLAIDGVAIGGVVWPASGDEVARLASQASEIAALASAWSLALRTCQLRDEGRLLSEHLADANRRLTGAQEQVTRHRALAGVGAMAAGAAHEMNNPLAVISGRSQQLAKELSDPRQAGVASTIVEQCGRLSDLIAELMRFAQPDPPRRSAASLGQILEHALVRAQASGELADTKIVTTIDEDAPLVLVDADQIAQAVAEVAANAVQAGAKRIELRAGRHPGGETAIVSVADDGRGMDAVTLSRACDPFFSAKPAGRRRGMGLARATRWIESSGGSLQLDSTLGEGTRATISLPVAPADPDGVRAGRTLRAARPA